jgi:vitamin B12 transporter
MTRPPLAGLLGLAALAAHAQQPPPTITRVPDPVVVTATRSLAPQTTLRDVTVITREELDTAGPLSLGEVLERLAGIELRATGGPGQPQGLFIRGSGTAQTLVLVDGMRVGSATVGTTSIENIPVEMIERIEVVKGPMSSLWGSDAMGGVVQIFTRGKAVPHLFVNAAYGSDRDRRVAAGLTTIDKGTAAVLTMGYRDVDAPSATTARVPFCHDPDRDPHDNAFATLRVAQRLWQGENVALEAFGSRGRTHFDGCGNDDRNEQLLTGVRVTSSATFAEGWVSRLAVGEGRDRIEIFGAFPDLFETRQDQASWVNEFVIRGGTMVLGVEALRQRVDSDATQFAVTERKTNSAFASVNEAWSGQRAEASWRYDDDDSFGQRHTGSAGYGFDLWGLKVSTTVARGFRAPTFYDLYGPTSDFYVPNPNLKPEQNKSTEIAIRSDAMPRVPFAWRVVAFDNRIDDLIAYTFPTVVNVNSARIRGVELGAQGTLKGVRWQASYTGQRPRDETTGRRLQGRAENYGTATGTYTWGSWSGGMTLRASGDRYDSPDESPGTRLAGYATLDARVRYKAARQWAVELTATNLTDKRYETSIGYEGARRGVMLSVRFDAF